MDVNTLLYLKWITSENLLYSTWNSSSFLTAVYMVYLCPHHLLFRLLLSLNFKVVLTCFSGLAGIIQCRLWCPAPVTPLESSTLGPCRGQPWMVLQLPEAVRFLLVTLGLRVWAEGCFLSSGSWWVCRLLGQGCENQRIFAQRTQRWEGAQLSWPSG